MATIPWRSAEQRLDRVGRRGDTLDQRLGRLVELADVIVAIVEPVAHLLPGQHAAIAGTGVDRLVHRLDPRRLGTIGAVERDQRMGDAGRTGRRALDLLQARHGAGEERVGQRLLDVGRQPRTLVLGEAGKIDPEFAVEREQQVHRDRPSIGLYLTEIAYRKTQPGGKYALGLAEPLAHRSEAAAGEELFTSRHRRFIADFAKLRIKSFANKLDLPRLFVAIPVFARAYRQFQARRDAEGPRRT